MRVCRVSLYYANHNYVIVSYSNITYSEVLKNKFVLHSKGPPKYNFLLSEPDYDALI